RGKYAALSHCWGSPGQQPFTTTADNLASRQSGIDFQHLPPTFRDAVIVASELGVQNLWIDSLCIIQDDADDWARESIRMAAVYGKAHVTIA
ncbi:heterokaryon incompatibility, partial [Lasiosphaeria miniovina]